MLSCTDFIYRWVMARIFFLLKMKSRYKRLFYVAGGGFVVYEFDKHFYYSTIQRNILTLYTGLVVTLDYKLNFNKENAQGIKKLHERVASRILDTCKSNGGLYIKFGQQIATVPVLPPEYNRFKQLFDNAPVIEYRFIISKKCY